MASSQAAISEAVALGVLAASTRAIVLKVVGATSGCLYCLRESFDLRSSGRGGNLGTGID